jgi:hypothetical protein
MRAVWAILFCLMRGMATAQSYQGGVRGAVVDADAVVPGVEIMLTNEDTRLSRGGRRDPRAIHARLSLDEPQNGRRLAEGGRQDREGRRQGVGTRSRKGYFAPFKQ